MQNAIDGMDLSPGYCSWLYFLVFRSSAPLPSCQKLFLLLFDVVQVLSFS
jgi:hypothetical protein